MPGGGADAPQVKVRVECLLLTLALTLTLTLTGMIKPYRNPSRPLSRCGIRVKSIASGCQGHKSIASGWNLTPTADPLPFPPLAQLGR